MTQGKGSTRRPQFVSDEVMTENWERVFDLARNILRDSPAAHKRRVALRHGVRDASELVPGCKHKHWDHTRHWCDDCGVTRVELIEEKTDAQT